MRQLSAEFDDFEVSELVAVDIEADECALLLPAAETGSTRVDMEEMEVVVVFHLEDM